MHKFPTIRKVWRAGHNQEITHDNVSFLEICEDVNKYVKKLPLGASSVLNFGAARIYSAELDDLLNDLLKLDKDLITRNKRTPVEDKPNKSSKTSSRSAPGSSEVSSSTKPASTKDSTSSTHSASTAPPTSLSLSGSTAQPASTSHTGTPRGSTNESLDEIQHLSESSSDHEDYFPLPLESSEQMKRSGDAENSFDYEYEDVSLKYTTSETWRHEASIRTRRYPSLSTIIEESSSFYRRPHPLQERSPSAVNRSVSERSKCKRSNSNIRTSNKRRSEVEPKRQKSDSSIDVSESGTTSNSDVLEEINQDESNLNKTYSVRTDGSSEDETNAVNGRPLSQNDVSQPTNQQNNKRESKSRKRKNDASTDISDIESSRLERTGDLDVTQETSHTEQEFNKTFIRATDENIDISDIDERGETLSENSIILQTKNVQGDKNPLRKKSKKGKDNGASHIKDSAAPTGVQSVSEAGNIIAPEAKTSRMKDQITQISPQSTAVLSSHQDAEPSTRRDQDTQVSPRQPENIEFDRNEVFGALFLYGPCQCDPRIPCKVIYSNVEGYL